MYLAIIGVVVFVLIVGLVIFRMLKYNLTKFNKENIGLIIISGIVVTAIEIPKTLFYSLLGLDLILLIIFVYGLVKRGRANS
jgi:tellurite resistance protein TehA-like permease